MRMRNDEVLPDVKSDKVHHTEYVVAADEHAKISDHDILKQTGR